MINQDPTFLMPPQYLQVVPIMAMTCNVFTEKEKNQEKIKERKWKEQK